MRTLSTAAEDLNEPRALIRGIAIGLGMTLEKLGTSFALDDAQIEAIKRAIIDDYKRHGERRGMPKRVESELARIARDEGGPASARFQDEKASAVDSTKPKRAK